MKFSINKNQLQNLLLEHQKVVPLRTTLPVLSCAFFSVSEKKLTIKTTDLEQTIVSKTNITNEENGSVCVLMSKLTEIVSALNNEEIKITVNEDLLVEINSNQGTYKITGRNTEEFREAQGRNPDRAESGALLATAGVQSALNSVITFLAPQIKGLSGSPKLFNNAIKKGYF